MEDANKMVLTDIQTPKGKKDIQLYKCEFKTSYQCYFECW